MDKELDLAVTCYGKVKPLKYDLVLLPWGATEPHNLHLPYLTDCILSHDIALDAAKLAKHITVFVAWSCLTSLPVHRIRDNASWISASIIAMKRKSDFKRPSCLSIRPGIPQNGHYQRTWRQYIQKYNT